MNTTERRLTQLWTKEVKDAYGKSGEKGAVGEEWLKNILVSKGYTVLMHQDDKEMQLKGIDLTVSRNDLSRTFTIDVKANIKQDGTFFIETSNVGWLYNPKKTSDLIWHVNCNTGWTARYKRSNMKAFISNMKSPDVLLRLNINELQAGLDFITVSRT